MDILTIEDLKLTELIKRIDSNTLGNIIDYKSDYGVIEGYALGIMHQEYLKSGINPVGYVNLFVDLLCSINAAPGLGSWESAMECLVLYTCFYTNSFNTVNIKKISDLDIHNYQNSSPNANMDWSGDLYDALEVQYRIAILTILSGHNTDRISKDILNHAQAKLNEAFEKVMDCYK